MPAWVVLDNIGTSRGPEFKNDNRGQLLEDFLFQVLSYNQLHIIEGPLPEAEECAVSETHSLDEKTKQYEIRLEARCYNISHKYWMEFLYPALVKYAKKWDCELACLTHINGERQIFFDLLNQPFTELNWIAPGYGDATT